MTGYSLRAPAVVGTFAVLLAGNVALGAALSADPAVSAALVLLPVVVVAVGALVASNRGVLVYLAIGFSLFSPLPLSGPIRGGLYPSDLLVLLAVGSWVAAWLTSAPERRPRWLQTPVLGLPLLLFGIALSVATLRGEVHRGIPLLGPSLRLVLYAGIAFAMTDLKPREVYRSLVVIFYAGTIWQVGVAFYGIATGTSATGAALLSTGGERVLAGSAAMYMVGALLLALLNLEVDHRAGRAALHLTIAGLASFALLNTFARTTFAVVAVLVPTVLLAYRRVGTRTLAFLPLFVPFVVLAALAIPHIDPEFYSTLGDRVTKPLSSDTSFQFREKATESVWQQVRTDPLFGVGFGRESDFTVLGERVTILQDPHNQFLYLWAGGGLVLLSSFLLLLLVYVFDARRRFREGTGGERRLVLWAVSLWFVFLVNSASGAILTSPPLLLVFWILMLLPMIVQPRHSKSPVLH